MDCKYFGDSPQFHQSKPDDDLGKPVGDFFQISVHSLRIVRLLYRRRTALRPVRCCGFALVHPRYTEQEANGHAAGQAGQGPEDRRHQSVQLEVVTQRQQE
jgi:hypothetical protein